jgi:hypothetical protein
MRSNTQDYSKNPFPRQSVKTCRFLKPSPPSLTPNTCLREVSEENRGCAASLERTISLPIISTQRNTNLPGCRVWWALFPPHHQFFQVVECGGCFPQLRSIPLGTHHKLPHSCHRKVSEGNRGCAASLEKTISLLVID